MARRSLALPPAAIDRWCQYAQGEVSHIAEATGFVNFELSYDGNRECRVITPQHYIITFANRDKGRPRYHSSFLTLRLALEDTLPEQVQVGVEVRGKDGESVVCGGEYVEFELLSLVNEASKQPSLRIAAGPVRVNPDTQQREFMRIDLGRCVRQIVTDIIDDPKHKGQKLVRSRWWICVEVLRLVCSANSLDCAALYTAGAPPLEWVICLVDEKVSASGNLTQDEKSIDELASFIDGGAGKRNKAKKKKKGKGESAVDDVADDTLEAIDNLLPETTHTSLPLRSDSESFRASSNVSTGISASLRPAPPPGWSRTVDLPPALVDAWRDCAGCDVGNVAESTSYVQFALNMSNERHRRLISPTQYVIAFPHVGAGQQRYHSALLTLHLVSESEIPGDTEGGVAAHLRVSGQHLEQVGAGAAESIEFCLLARENEAPVQTPLRFTAGPVRINDKTGQRESMRLDLGECVRWSSPDFVEGSISGRPTRLVRQKWWVCIETLRLICIANALDCRGLDEPDAPPLEWVACLVDDRTPTSNRAIDMLDGMNAHHLRTIFDNLPRLGGCNGASTGSSSEASKAKSKKKKGGETSEAAISTTTKPAPKSGNESKANTQSPPVAKVAPAKPKVAPASTLEKKASPKQANPIETTISPSGPSECTAEDDEDSAEFVDAAESELPQVEVKRPSANDKSAPPSRTLALPSALIDSWCNFAKKSISHVAEASGFLHFEINFDREKKRRMVLPEHYIIAFPNRDKGRQRYHSSLLTMKIVKEADVPLEVRTRPQLDECRKGDVDHVEFELLLRVHEAPVQQQLRVTAGPVRINPATGQRESMRIDMGRCVRQITTDVIDDPRGKRVVRNRWWICVEMLRLVCTANSLDCKALDEEGHPPVEWVVCLVDERGAPNTEAKQQAEERNIDELIDFIDGKGSGSKKKKKKKPKEKNETVETLTSTSSIPEPPPQPVPAPTFQPQATQMSASQAAAQALSQVGALTSSLRIDPLVQTQAAAQLLAEVASSASNPQEAAAAKAAAEAARLAVEAAQNSRSSSTAQTWHPPAPRRAAADILKAQDSREAIRPLPAGRSSTIGHPPAPSGFGSISSAQPPARGAAARPLLSSWEPTPLPTGYENADDDDWPPSVGGVIPGLGERAERAFDGLESLLAGLRSEFSEESRSTKRWESNPGSLGNRLFG